MSDRLYETTDEANSANPAVTFQIVETAWGLSIRCLKDGQEMARGRFDYFDGKLQFLYCKENHTGDEYEKNITLVDNVATWQPSVIKES